MRLNTADFQPSDPAHLLSWVHFGDLHLTTDDCRNYQDFTALIDAANAHLPGPGSVSVAFLPGDNADDGSEAQYTIHGSDRGGAGRFSVTCLDGDVVSWKFKELTTPWPFVMITSPADERFLTSRTSPVRKPTQIRARVWSANGIHKVWCQVGPQDYRKMEPSGEPGVWTWKWDPKGFPEGPHRLTVWAVDGKGESAHDTINVLVDRTGVYQPPRPKPTDMGNRIGAYSEKGISGTLLGPNLRGHPW